MLVIQTDNAHKFKALVLWGDQIGIEFKFIKTHTPPQNSVVEWFNWIILEITRALLFDTKISKLYWKYTVATTNYLWNHTVLIHDSADEDGCEKTPYELWFSYKPDLSYLRAWSCCMLYHDSTVESKLDSCISEDTFVMYGKSDKQYYVLPWGKMELKLITNPEFHEQEDGFLEKVLANGPVPQPMNIEDHPAMKTPEVSSGSRGAVAALKEPHNSQDAIDLDQTTVKP